MKKKKKKRKKHDIGRIPVPQKAGKIMQPKKGKGSYKRKSKHRKKNEEN